jgi:hypothetical protein
MNPNQILEKIIKLEEELEKCTIPSRMAQIRSEIEELEQKIK